MPHDTYSPAQVAVAFVESAMAKAKVHPIVTFGKAFNGGMFLAFGATLSTIVGGGSPGLTASNPGIERLLSAAVFPGIGCNILVCLSVWQATGARETISKIVAIWVGVFCFVACSFDHVIANMYFVPLGMLYGAPISVGYYIRKSMIAAGLGNIVGALVLGVPFKFYYLSSAGAFDATSPPVDIERGLGMRDGTMGGAAEPTPFKEAEGTGGWTANTLNQKNSR